jgi:deoxyribose-phosphate aldolase
MRTVDKVMVEHRCRDFQSRSIKTSAKRSGLRLAMSMLDLTTLEGKDSPEKVRALCRKAIAPHAGTIDGEAVPSCAAVCVYPSLVATARAALAGTSIKVASVATGFPSGQYPLSVRLDDTRRAIADGADEIDMVINRGAFLAGRFAEVAEEIREVKRVCLEEGTEARRHEGTKGEAGQSVAGAALKVILETGELETLDNVRRASDLAIEAMAAVDDEAARGNGLVPLEPGVFDFIKTSTGKVQPAATLPVSLVMLEAIRDHWLATGGERDGRVVAFKPAGGIRTAKQSLHYLVMVKETLGDAWLDPNRLRIGASTLANDIVRQLLKLAHGGYSASYDVSEA